jgi:hypothetical protein
MAAITYTTVLTNTPPVAVTDSYTTEQGVELVISAIDGLLANDLDEDGDPLTAALIPNPLNGQLTWRSDGSFIYRPDAGFLGIDTLTYMAYDGQALSSPATVAIRVERGPVSTYIPFLAGH